MSSIIELQDVSFTYPGMKEEILQHISLKIHPHEMLAIVGPNGGGKSTLLKLILGLIGHPSVGKIQWLPGLKISYVPQVSSFNSLLPLRVQDVLALNGGKEKNLQRSELMELFRLNKKEKSLFSHLSPGEKQRVLIVKGMLENPQLMILDEPLAGIDSEGQDQIMQLLAHLKKEKPLAILMVEHHLAQILKYADGILCLNRSIHWHDKTELFNPQVLLHLYHCEFEHLVQHQQGKWHV